MITFNTLKLVFLHPLLWWLLSVAIVIWAVLVVQMKQTQKLYLADRLAILLLLFLAATFGGDLYVSLSEYITASFGKIFTTSLVLSGQKGTIGAILSSAIVVISYLKIRKIPVLEYADLLVPFVALAYAVARIGCFTNGDDFGVLSSLPWSVNFGPFTEAYETHLSRGWINSGAVESLRVHPTQLYHAAAGLAGFVLLKTWQSNWQGSRFALAWIYYGVTRFSIQFFRDDHWADSAMIDTAQWFSLLFIIFGLVLWFYHKVSLNREELVIAGLMDKRKNNDQ